MEIEILASGSKGNVTTVKSGGSLLLIDCGKAFGWTIKRLNNRLPDALIITHEHGDHAYAAKQFLMRGVDVYTTAGTIQALGLCERHNLHTIAKGDTFRVISSEWLAIRDNDANQNPNHQPLNTNHCREAAISGVEVTAIESFHDAAEPVNFILQDADDRILFVTDTSKVPHVDGDFTKIFIEANYSTSVLMDSELAFPAKWRILHSHLSIEDAERFLQDYPRAEVSLLHISKRHGDEEEFYKRLERIKNGEPKKAYEENCRGNKESGLCWSGID